MKIAVLLRGFHFLWKDRFGFPLDGRRHLASLQRSIIEPLRRDHEVDIFFATYDSPILGEITAALQPKGVILPDPKKSTQVSTFVEGLEMIQAQPVPYDRVVCTRFDLEYLKPIDQWNIDPAGKGVFFLWREYEKAWNIEHYSADMVHLVDRDYIEIFKKGLNSLSRKLDLHHLYDGVAPYTSDLHFIVEGHYDSNTMYWNKECYNPIYRMGNRPHLPVCQPWHIGLRHGNYSFRERWYARWATLLTRPAAWWARATFRPGFPKP